ncbi:FadR/GntR family transcriptional regulator [Calderihabitans maritimus]|uniref:Transcriptional regulator n=1 Tax=Calderihabitans maritimus TaxID=1246530 RepID=A0A1Z5HPU9_9FIRM|nr:FadR/GntR family transcriptional regulator [Calderihabitans maritimus]GAW91310.1 transcriptional regulator [Calderihabitans maritimus]
MKFKPIKHRRIYEEIVSQIKELIIDGSLNPGDKLLSERELADALKVSRTSVREALSALEIAGLVEIRPGEGTFIRHTDLDSVIEPLALMFLLERDKVRELLEVRKALEVEAIGLAAERADEEDFVKIERALEEMKEALKTGDNGAKADLKFHYAVVEASKNSLLVRLMNTVYDTMNQTLRTTRELWLSHTKGTPERLFQEHQEMFQAMKARDRMKARRVMYEHLKKVEEELIKIEKEAKAGIERGVDT